MAASSGITNAVGFVIEAMKVFIDTSKTSNESMRGVKSSKTEVLKCRLLHSMNNLHAKLNLNDQCLYKVMNEQVKEYLNNKHCELSDVVWLYVVHALFLLRLLNDALMECGRKVDNDTAGNRDDAKMNCEANTEETMEVGRKIDSSRTTRKNIPSIPEDSLSVSEQKITEILGHIIVCFGICPYFQPGVGMPLHMRSGISDVLQEIVKSVQAVQNQLCNDRRLYISTLALMSCLKHEFLRSLLLSRHLVDLVAALCQLGYSNVTSTEVSVYKDDKEQDEHGGIETMPPYGSEDQDLFHVLLTEQHTSLSSKDRMYCAKCLRQLLRRAYQPMVVNVLFALQSGAASDKKLSGSTKVAQQSRPTWLKAACGYLLSDLVLQPNGLISILQVTVDEKFMLNKHGPQDWKRYEALAKLISTRPMQVKSANDYYENICNQIRKLIHISECGVKRLYLRISIRIVECMAQKHPNLVEEYFFQPILRPLALCLCSNDCNLADNITVVTENELDKCIKDIHLILIGTNDIALLSQYFYPIVHPLFCCYCYAQNTVSHLRPMLKEILITLLRGIDLNEITAYLERLIYGEAAVNLKGAKEHATHDKVKFFLGTEGGIEVKTEALPNFTTVETVDLTINYHWQVSCFIEVLKEINSNELTGKLFLMLLSNLHQITNAQQNYTSLASNFDGSHANKLEFLAGTERDRHLRYKIITLYVLGAICNTIDPKFLMSEKDQLFDFIISTIKRVVSSMQDEEGDTSDESNLLQETADFAVTLLSVILSDTKQVNTKDWTKVQELLPDLKELQSLSTNLYLSQTAGNVFIRIATRGAVLSDTTTEELPKQSIDFNKPEVASAKGLVTSYVSELDCTLRDNLNLSDVGKQKSQSEEYQHRKADGKDVSYELAMDELQSPFLPVRAAGLRKLAKLIIKKEPTVIKDIRKLEEMIMAHLEDSDSYIYLSAVQALVALADILPDSVMPRIAQEVANDSPRQGKSMRSPELRLKLGEALVQATRRCGEVLPRYVHSIISAILSGVKDEDGDIRSSSLSQLAEICKLLRYSIYPMLYEVINCVSNVAKSDKVDQVRRGAINVITFLLKGLGKDMLQLTPTGLKELYRLLKYVHNTDVDSVVRLHSQLALKELEIILKEFLFPETKMEKRISILD